jgi:hypothetical protein
VHHPSKAGGGLSEVDYGTIVEVQVVQRRDPALLKLGGAPREQLPEDVVVRTDAQHGHRGVVAGDRADSRLHRGRPAVGVRGVAARAGAC